MEGALWVKVKNNESNEKTHLLIDICIGIVIGMYKAMLRITWACGCPQASYNLSQSGKS